MYFYKKNLKGVSQHLRKEMTLQEKHLWYDFLKKLPVSVKRQKILENYIVDFYIPRHKIVIEIDGNQHLTEENQANDEKRDLDLTSLGIRVLRYKNKDIDSDFNNVCNDILNQLNLTIEDIQKN